MRAGLFLLSWLLTSALFAQDWQRSLAEAFKQHQVEADGQTVLLFIETADTSIFIKFGPNAERYNANTFFRAGGLLPLRQAYYAVQAEGEQQDFLLTEIRKNVNILQVLTHRSGYPRYPWHLEECTEHLLDSFLEQYPLPAKTPFQISYVATTLLEKWMRTNVEDYPGFIRKAWGFELVSDVPTEQKAKARIVRHPSPIPCWSFCMTCEEQSAYIQAQQIRQFIRNIAAGEDPNWLIMASPRAKTPVSKLQSGLGFQLATNLRQLPMAMHYSSDAGNALFIGWTPATKTLISILADSDQPVDNLGIRLMSSFHRDILNFHP